MLNSTIKKTLEEVREIFFPRWDKKREWELEIADILSIPEAQGVFNIKEKILEIKRDNYDLLELKKILIHEICHSIGQGHGKVWRKAMQQKAEIALQNGQKKLSQLILKEIESYLLNMEDIEGMEELLAAFKNFDWSKVPVEPEYIIPVFHQFMMETLMLILKQTEIIKKQHESVAKFTNGISVIVTSSHPEITDFNV